MKTDPKLARETKAIVVIAFRNGPIEDVHAGKTCPICWGKEEYSHITQGEMKQIMKTAVDRVYTLLWLRSKEPKVYEGLLRFADSYSRSWDDPTLTTDL